MKNNPLVSVIIPTRNNSRYLGSCLRSIKAQTYKNIEIIVVDNNSKDDTKKIAEKYTSNVFNKGPERTAQVNFGARMAKGQFIYYTGADLDRDNTIIEEAVNTCIVNNCDAIYTNVKTRINQESNIWEKVRAMERDVYFKQPGMNAARFYKKDVFVSLNGYDEQLGGVSDDLEFQHRINISNFKTCFIDSTEYNTDEYRSLKMIIRKSLYYGWQIKRYMNKHPQKTKKQYQFVRNEFITNRHILMKDKVVFFYFLIYRIIQYIFGGIGYVLATITKDNHKVEKFLYSLNY